MADTKNYQKTSSRSANSQSAKQINISKQSIKYMIINPLDVNYKYHQEMYSE